MKVLVVKTSSMGDVIHTLPALTDAGNAIPNITFDWVVEENFAEIPKWHGLIKQVIPVALRRWRKNIFSSKTRKEFREFCHRLRATEYDLVIDAQGLLKSAFVTSIARGERAGMDWNSAREPLASIFYQKKVSVEKKQHAITRVRSLFSQALGYQLPTSVPMYGIDRQQFIRVNDDALNAGGAENDRTRAERSTEHNYLVFLHGTTWPTKHWPEEYWIELTRIANSKGFHVKLPWGNPAEKERAERIAKNSNDVEVLPRLDLLGMARVLAGAKAVAAVDTGLGHLTAALDVPAVSLYGPTNPILTGALGQSQVHLTTKFPCSPCLSRDCTYSSPLKSSPLYPPCFSTLPPAVVWDSLVTLL